MRREELPWGAGASIVLAAAALGVLGQTSFAEDRDGGVWTVAALTAAVEEIARELEGEPNLRTEFTGLVESHGMAGGEAQFREFVRVRLAFEAVRDGGLWGLRWTITDREPNSIGIWSQWAAWEPVPGEADVLASPTADAECDELSALCALLARRLGAKQVGLFWPQTNHTVAVWTTAGIDDEPVRIVLPTSQMFLGPKETLGTLAFDPWSQRTIYPYDGVDVADDFILPTALVEMLLLRLREEGASSKERLQELRNRRSQRVGGS